MMKKWIAWVCMISILFTFGMGTGVIAAQDSGAAQTQQPVQEITAEQELLIALGIVSLNSYGTIDQEKEVTRAEFASVCGKILNISPSLTASRTYFTDVTPESWFAYTVNTLAELGTISQPENRLFEPERAVTVAEAVKMLVNLMGYGAYAEERGGYPNGYLAVAYEENLLSGGNGGDALTNRAMADLVYRALHAAVMETEYRSGGNRYYRDEDKTLLSVYQGTYITDGVVEAVYGMSLVDQEVPEGKVLVGGTEYAEGSLAVRDYLGYRVEVYYTADDADNRALRYMSPIRSEELVILSDDLISCTGLGGQITYGAGDKIKKASIDAAAVVIRNGSVVKAGLEDAFRVQNGEIRLVDSTADGVYETVIIYDFQTIVVNTFNAETGILVDTIDPKTVIDISPLKYVSVFSDSGAPVGLSAITKKSVIDLALSEDHAIIYVNSANFEGTVEGVTDDAFEIGGTAYRYYEPALASYPIRLGDSGTFKTNRYGKIAFFKSGSTSNDPGFLMDVAKRTVIGETVFLKMLASDGSIAELEVAEKLELDGVKLELEKFRALESLKNTVVMYRTNAEGKVVYIDSTERGSGEEEDSLVKDMSLNTDGHRWNSTTRMFDRTVLCNADAVIFRVPSVDSAQREDDAYSVVAMSSLENNRLHQAEAYRMGDTPYCHVVVLYATKYIQSYGEGLIFVEKVTRGIDSQGEDIYIIRGYQNGTSVTLEMEYPHEIVPSRGDCIRVGRDQDGKVGLIEIHYDFERDGSGAVDEDAYWYWPPVDGQPYDAINNYWNGTFNDLQAQFRLGFGYPVEIDGDVVKWSFSKDSTAIGEVAQVTSATPVVVYDVESDQFLKGSIDDVMAMNTYGENCSTLIASFRWGTITALYLINNRR